MRYVASSAWRSAALVAAMAAVPTPSMCAPTGGAAQGDLANQLSTPLTLDRAIRIALDHQQTIRIAGSALEAARARVTEARSAYFPQITPIYQYSNRKAVRVPVSGGSAVSEGQVAGINATQMIFDTGRRENSVEQSKFLARAAQYTVLDQRQNVILNVTAAFYAYLRNKELVRVAEASVENARTTLEATRAFVEAGTARRIDTFQAEADYANTLVQLSQARNNMRVALAELRNALGIITPVQIVTDDTRPPQPDLKPDTTPLQQYFEQGVASRLDLKSDVESTRAQRRTLNISRIEAGLQVQADVSAGYQLEPERGDDRTFTTTFTYPLFDAGAAGARVHSARASLDRSIQQEQQTRQAIQLEIETAHYQREAARERIGATQSALTAARQNFEAARDSQREGAGDIIAVIQAQTQLVTAETNAVQALYDFHTADAQLRRAVGANDPYRTEKPRP
jgi:outer membrane protein